MLAAVYGLLSALTWGGGDFAGGLSSRRNGALRAVFYADWVGVVLLLGWLSLDGEAFPGWSVILLAAVAGLLGTLGLLALYQALATGQMSIATPVSALLAAAIPVGVAAFTEGLPGWFQVAGFALALGAVWLVSSNEGGPPQFKTLADLRLPFLSGIGFGAYFVLIEGATQAATIWPMIASRTSGTIIILFILLARRESLGIVRDSWPIVLLNAGLDVVGNTFYVLATQTGRLDVAAVLASLYPGGTVMLAWWFLKERLSRGQWLGILLALAAIVLLTLQPS